MSDAKWSERLVLVRHKYLRDVLSEISVGAERLQAETRIQRMRSHLVELFLVSNGQLSLFSGEPEFESVSVSLSVVWSSELVRLRAWRGTGFSGSASFTSEPRGLGKPSEVASGLLGWLEGLEW